MTFRYSKGGFRDSSGQMKDDRENIEITRIVSDRFGWVPDRFPTRESLRDYPWQGSQFAEKIWNQKSQNTFYRRILFYTFLVFFVAIYMLTANETFGICSIQFLFLRLSILILWFKSGVAGYGRSSWDGSGRTPFGRFKDGFGSHDLVKIIQFKYPFVTPKFRAWINNEH